MDARQNRNGQPLPYRMNVPAYCIFPFWTDLLIVEGKPHGIYYEIRGQAPQRTLIVEWYVTRYGQEDQYFHFYVKIKEAEPGVVEFKYFNAADEGRQSTIGVQGLYGRWMLVGFPLST